MSTLDEYGALSGVWPNFDPALGQKRQKYRGSLFPFNSSSNTQMSLQVASEDELKSTYFYSYFTPNFILFACKYLIIKQLQNMVRVSFSAPNASQKCGAFLFGG